MPEMANNISLARLLWPRMILHLHVASQLTPYMAPRGKGFEASLGHVDYLSRLTCYGKQSRNGCLHEARGHDSIPSQVGLVHDKLGKHVVEFVLLWLCFRAN